MILCISIEEVAKTQQVLRDQWKPFVVSLEKDSGQKCNNKKSVTWNLEITLHKCAWLTWGYLKFYLQEVLFTFQALVFSPSAVKTVTTWSQNEEPQCLNSGFGISPAGSLHLQSSPWIPPEMQQPGCRSQAIKLTCRWSEEGAAHSLKLNASKHIWKSSYFRAYLWWVTNGAIAPYGVAAPFWVSRWCCKMALCFRETCGGGL